MSCFVLLITDLTTMLREIEQYARGVRLVARPPHQLTGEDWDRAALVLLDAQAALLRARPHELAARDAVMLLAHPEDGDEPDLCGHALALGAAHLVTIPDDSGALRKQMSRLAEHPAVTVAVFGPDPSGEVGTAERQLDSASGTGLCGGAMSYPGHASLRGRQPFHRVSAGRRTVRTPFGVGPSALFFSCLPAPLASPLRPNSATGQAESAVRIPPLLPSFFHSVGRPLMKTSCERPYRSMIATAGAVRRLPEQATERHVRRLATELAHAVFDLDARVRAGLDAPRTWQPVAPRAEAHQTFDPSAARAPDDNRAQDDETGDRPNLDAPVFYLLPADDLEEGMSTDDGQDIVSVTVLEDGVFADVYTPRSDDPEQDEENRHDTECRMYRPDELVGMATFVDTEIDGSEADNAQPHPHSPPCTD